jgi:hypothetical protein
MLDRINEADWKVLRELKTIALERFCERALSELSGVASASGKSANERYLAVFDLVHRRNDELAKAFDDLRRSTAMLRLACIKSYGLLTEEEMGRFSPETRNFLDFLVPGRLD